MQDIREDLSERKAEIARERAFREARTDELRAREASIDLLIETESALWRQCQAGPHPLPDENGEDSLGPMLRAILADGGRRHRHLDDVVAAIKHQGYDFGEKSPGRVVHFALIGMAKHGIVRQLGDGYWSKATANEEAAGLV